MQKYAEPPNADDSASDPRVVSQSQPLPFSDDQHSLARQWRRDEGIGATKIRNRLLTQFPEGEVAAIRTIDDWIKGVPYIKGKDHLDAPYDHQAESDVEQIGLEVRSYVRRLSILKPAFFDGEKLTNREAQAAERVFAEFNDPYGDRVDLFAQYAVVCELAEREAVSQPTEDIEDLFAFAPWRSDKDSAFYWIAGQTGRIDTYAILRRLMAPFDSPALPVRTLMSDPVYSMLIGAHAQLNLPYFISWRSPGTFHFAHRANPELARFIHLATNKPHPKPTETKKWAVRCDWRTDIASRGDKPLRRLSLDVAPDKQQEASND